MTENRSGLRDEERGRMVGQLLGAAVGGAEQQRPEVGRGDRDREADGQRDERPAGQREPAVHERDADAGERPELGPDDHRADDQDHRVGQDPDPGDQRREHHEGEEAARELGALGGAALDLLPDDGVGRRAAAACSAARAAVEIAVSIVSIAIVPCSARPRSRSSARTTLASSRATSQRIRSPLGRRATPGRWTTLITDAFRSSTARTRSASAGGATIRRWIIRGS